MIWPNSVGLNIVQADQVESSHDRCVIAKAARILLQRERRKSVGFAELVELGFTGYDIGTWWGLLAPAGTPPGIVQKLNAAMRKVVQAPSVKERFAPHGLDATSDSPQEFAAFVKDETQRYARIAKGAGIPPE